MKQKNESIKNSNFSFDILTSDTNINENLSLALNYIDFFQRRSYFGPFYKTNNKVIARYEVLNEKTITAMNYVANGKKFDANLRIFKPTKDKTNFNEIASSTFKVKIERVYFNEHFSYESNHAMHFYVEMKII